MATEAEIEVVARALSRASGTHDGTLHQTMRGQDLPEDSHFIDAGGVSRPLHFAWRRYAMPARQAIDDLDRFRAENSHGTGGAGHR